MASKSANGYQKKLVNLGQDNTSERLIARDGNTSYMYKLT